MTQPSLPLAPPAEANRPQQVEFSFPRHPMTCLALIPACLAVGTALRHSAIGQAHPVLLGLLLLASCAVSYAGALIWSRRVPPMVSLTAGLIGWTFGLWLLANGRI